MRMLIMITSAAHMPSTDARTGVSLDSFACGYFAATDMGFEVTVCSPSGGAAVIDPLTSSDRQSPTPIARRFNGDRRAREVFSDALPLADICPSDFSGVYVPDGLGALFDLTKNPDAQRLMTWLHDAARPCALVGFGLAALLGLVTPDGRPLVAGRRLTRPDKAEALPDGAPRLDQALAQLGAILIAGPANVSHVVQDGTWITGQNAASSELAARTLMLALAR
jgi:putative intracellular protease/amidase